MENSIEEDIRILKNAIADNQNKITNPLIIKALEHILSDYEGALKEARRYKNMYEAEHEIHLVRNEQLKRKENAIVRCNELENENKTIKEANDYWRLRYCESLNNSIPIQKIKDKIKELETKGVYQGDGYYCSGAKLVLQELLESKV